MYATEVERPALAEVCALQVLPIFVFHVYLLYPPQADPEAVAGGGANVGGLGNGSPPAGSRCTAPGGG